MERKEFKTRYLYGTGVYSRNLLLVIFLFLLVAFASIAGKPRERLVFLFMLLIIIPIVIYFFYRYYNRALSKRTYIVDDSHIETFDKEIQESNLKFSEIGQIYRYRDYYTTDRTTKKGALITSLAYRRNDQEPWIPVRKMLIDRVHREDGGVLAAHIEQKFLETHLDNALEKLKNDGAVIFPFVYFDSKDSRRNIEHCFHLLSTRYKDNEKLSRSIQRYFQTYQGLIILQKNELFIGERVIPLEKGDYLKIVPVKTWSLRQANLLPRECGSTIQIFSQHGEQKISFATCDVINSILLEELLKNLMPDYSERD